MLGESRCERLSFIEPGQHPLQNTIGTGRRLAFGQRFQGLDQRQPGLQQRDQLLTEYDQVELTVTPQQARAANWSERDDLHLAQNELAAQVRLVDGLHYAGDNT